MVLRSTRSRYDPSPAIASATRALSSLMTVASASRYRSSLVAKWWNKDDLRMPARPAMSPIEAPA